MSQVKKQFLLIHLLPLGWWEKKHDQQHLIWQLLYLRYMQKRDSCHTGVSSLFSSEEGAIIELLHSFRGEMTDGH